MILQFRGFKNNWIYEEAETIAISIVKISKEKIKANDSNDELAEIKNISDKIDKEIREATSGANLVYITDKPVCELGHVKVAVLHDKSKDVTYVFDIEREAYLLNSNGKTVRKV